MANATYLHGMIYFSRGLFTLGRRSTHFTLLWRSAISGGTKTNDQIGLPIRNFELRARFLSLLPLLGFFS
jgi:hypothetical protein